MENKRPRIGIGVLVIKEGKALLGKRKGAHGAGMYAGPGGHLEDGESFTECAKRETREEAGIEIENLRFLSVTNCVIDGKQYVDIGFAADWAGGDPILREPEKCEGWAWFPFDRLPQPLFPVLPHYVTALEGKRQCYDLID